VNEDVGRRVGAMHDAITERFGGGPLIFAALTCDGCGRTVDVRERRDLDGWVGGPPDYCPTCCKR